jgi:glycosyltransferase involved in cell wall biosynthesis
MISVVVAVRNGLPWLDEQLAALVRQECGSEWEVLVVDNGSTDDTSRLVESWASSHSFIRLVDGSECSGPSFARNAGVAAARGELVAFCDADDVVQPGWLEALRLALSRSDVVAGSFEFGALNGGLRSEPRLAATRQLGHLPAGLGANLGVRRSAFEAVGGFDEELRTGEDIDLCWRLQLQGYTFGSEIRAVVAKRERTGALEVFRHGVVYGRSGARLYRKHRIAGIRPERSGALKSWAWVVLAVPSLYKPAVRRRWFRAAGVRVGRLIGSVENRVFFP